MAGELVVWSTLLVSLPEVGTLQSGACAAGSIDKNVGEFIHSSASTVTSYLFNVTSLSASLYADAANCSVRFCIFKSVWSFSLKFKAFTVCIQKPRGELLPSCLEPP